MEKILEGQRKSIMVFLKVAYDLLNESICSDEGPMHETSAFFSLLNGILTLINSFRVSLPL